MREPVPEQPAPDPSMTSLPAEVLEGIADRTCAICDGEWCAVGVVAPASDRLRVERWVTAPRELSAGLSAESADAGLEPTLRQGLAHRSRRPGGPFASDDPRISGTAEALVLSIRVDGRLEGLLCVGRSAPAAFTDREEALLASLAEQSGIVIAHARLLAEARRRRREAEELAQVGQVMSQSLDSEEVSRRIVASMQRLLGTLTCILYGLRTTDEAMLDPWAASGVACDRIPPHGRGVGAIALALDERCTVTTRDLLGDPRIRVDPGLDEYIRDTDHGAVLAVPLFAGGRPIGVLAARGRTGREWTVDEVRLAEMFADHAAVALQNAQLHAQVTAAALMQERVRIASGLHDTLSQLAFSVGLKLDWCLHRVGRRSALRPKLEDIRRDAGQMMEKIRQLIGHVAAERPEESTFAGGLERFAQDFRELTGCALDLAVAGDAACLSAASQDAIEKALQEALVNVAKHARATRVAVRVEIGPAEATFAVIDDGVGLLTGTSDGRSGHFGLRQMRERIEGQGGWLDIRSEPGTGTQVRGGLPVDSSSGQRPDHLRSGIDRGRAAEPA